MYFTCKQIGQFAYSAGAVSPRIEGGVAWAVAFLQPPAPGLVRAAGAGEAAHPRLEVQHQALHHPVGTLEHHHRLGLPHQLRLGEGVDVEGLRGGRQEVAHVVTFAGGSEVNIGGRFGDGQVAEMCLVLP